MVSKTKMKNQLESELINLIENSREMEKEVESLKELCKTLTKQISEKQNPAPVIEEKAKIEENKSDQKQEGLLNANSESQIIGKLDELPNKIEEKK